MTSSNQEIVQRLSGIVGAGGVLTGDDVSARTVGIWRGEPMQAKAIVRPRTTAEVSAVMKTCFDAGQTVVAQGGRTNLAASADTSDRDIVVSLERMNQIEEISTVDRTMTVQSGVLLQTIQERADECGLMYPLDIGARGSCTIGGNIATNAGGNRVIRYGMTRDMVLGVEAVLADGTVVASMNEMIKNNAGYDLKQLFIGSEGTLGIVTRAVLRLREQPRSQETMFVAVDEFDKLPTLLKLMDAKLGGTLSAFEVMWDNFYRLVTTEPAKSIPPISGDYPYYVLIEAMGGDEQNDGARAEAALTDAYESGLVADAVVAQSEAQRMGLWAMRDDVEQVNRFHPRFIFDVSMRVSKMAGYVDHVNSRLESEFDGAYKNFTFGHIGDGNIHFAISAGDDEGAHAAVERCVYEPLADIGGSVSAEHGVGLEKKPYLGLSRTIEELDLMRTLKRALDPKGILNPGIIFDC
ncbi:MAG: FAD-binding oxidoreductase [Gammaproteobacteria bacterium]|nr:FAD-binding oxidoreductase [Gammaproteobacteria bacterium]